MRGLIALSWDDGLNALVAEGIEAIVFRTVGDQCSLWESVLPEELLRLPEELARVDALLDDPAFFAPFVPFFDPRDGSSVHTDGDLSAVDVCEVSLSAGL
jgi:transposase, IS5 family